MADRGILLESEPPRFDTRSAATIAARYFGIEALAEPLDSERDQNFRLRAPGGEQYVLKIANPAEDPAAIDFENAVLEHLLSVAPEMPVPRIVPSVAKTNVVTHSVNGVRYLVRCLTWLRGRCVNDVELTADLGRQLGMQLARLGRALRGLFHPAAGKCLLWDMRNLPELASLVPDIEDAGARVLCARFIADYAKHVLPKLAALRAQVIYNDLHGGNVLVDDGAPPAVCGIVDFGDTLHGPLICDVAVAAAYQLSAGDDPFVGVTEFVTAYNEVTPLEGAELDLLPDLIVARLVTSLTIGTRRARLFPENRAYLTVDLDSTAARLQALSRIPAADTARRFREACGIPAGPACAANRRGDAELQDRRKSFFGPSLRLFYDRPVNVMRGEGVWLFDAAGDRYLDAYNNVPLVGHCHPEVVAALGRQAATLNTHTRYLNDAVVDYAERLLALFPASLDRVLFSCTGSEANELALRVARAFTGNEGIIVTRCAYHGNTTTIAELSPSDSGRDTFPPWMETIPAPDTYRRAGLPDSAQWVQDYLDEVDAALARMLARGIKPAALLLDSGFTSDGMFLPPPGVVTGAADRVRAAGGVLIADEVQSGFGRLGKAMWGFEIHGAKPEIVTLGKPIGNGHPLAATLMQHEVLDAFMTRHHYFNTFGGNPVSSQVGLAVLEVFERDGLLRNSRDTGAYLKDCLGRLAENYPCIGDVRSLGLFAGVELVADRVTREPATGLADRVCNNMRALRVLISTEGPHGNVLKIRPPLPFARRHVDQLLEAMQQSLDHCL